MSKDTPAAPPAPDYNALAVTQGAQNVETARVQAQLNNPNFIGPNGSRTVDWGKTFDQSGYDKAMAAYNTGTPDVAPTYGVVWNGMDEAASPSQVMLTPGSKGTGTTGTAPTKEQFTKFSDTPTITDTLSPTQQSLLDSQGRISQNLANVGETGLNRVSSAMATPFDTSILTQRSSAPTVPQSVQGPTVSDQTGIAQYGQLPGQAQYANQTGATNYQNASDIAKYQGMNGTANYQDANGVSQYGDAPSASQFQNFNQTSQYNTPLASADSASADRVARAMYERAAIPMAYQNQLQTNQAMVGGHNLGGSALNAIGDTQNRGWNDLALASIAAGGQEQSRLFGLQQATQQAADTRENSLYSQGLQNAGFNNANAQAAYNQAMGIAQLGDTRQNTQQAQGFQNLQANNANQTNLYNQQLQNAGFNNANATAQQQQGFQNLQVNNQNATNTYNQQFANTGFNNQNLTNQYNQNFQNAALGDTRANSQFAQTEAAKNSLFNQQSAAAKFQADQNANQFSQGAQLFGLQGQARAQDVQEQAYLRGLSLNELNALRSGSQVTAPQFQQYAGGGQIAAPPTMQGATLGYQAALGPYNAQLASNNAQTQGLYGLGASALGAYGTYAGLAAMAA